MKWAVALCLVGSPLFAGPPPNAATTVFNAKCDDVASVAVPLFQKRGWLGNHVGPAYPRCARTVFCFHLSADKLRTVHGFPIFNGAGRYAVGGNWHSMFTGYAAKGGDGTLRLAQKSEGACAVALEFRISTAVAGGGVNEYTDSDGNLQTTYTEYTPRAGPWLESNGRLEREYMDSIRKAFDRRKP